MGRKSSMICKYKGRMLGGSLPLVALCAALAPSAAWAQDDTPEARSFNEIVVTAERRSARAVDTPISITVMSADTLEKTGYTDFRSLAMTVPGMRMDSNGNEVQASIRGITTTVAGIGSSPNIVTYIDGFYIPTGSQLAMELPDMENVQVLKGPQGTLFGRNATGGAILVSLKEPSDMVEGSVSLGYGTYNERLGKAYVSGPLAPNLYASATASYIKSHSYVRNILTGQRDGGTKNWLLRGKLKYEASDWLTLNLRVEHVDIDSPQAWVYRNGGTNSLAENMPGEIITSQRYRTAGNHKAVLRNKTDGIYFSGDIRVGEGNINVKTGYQKMKSLNELDFDASSITLDDIDFYQEYKTFTQEIVYTLNTGPLSLNVGGFYLRENDIMPYFSVDGINYVSDQVKSSSLSGFIDGTYNVAGGLYLTAGIRYSRERAKMIFPIAPEHVGIYPDTVMKGKWKSWTPRFVARYQIDNGTNVYASYSKGFKAGMFDGYAPGGPSVNPEKIDAWEVGLKHSGDILQASIAGFLYKYKDLQFTGYTTEIGGGLISILSNVGRAKIYGIEANVAVQATDSLQFTAGGTWLRPRYSSFPGATGYVPIPGGGWDTAPFDASGSQMIRAAKLSGNIGTTFTQPLADGEIVLSANLFLTTKTYDRPGYQFLRPGYHSLDAGVTWTSGNENWQLSLTGKNLTNKYHINFWDPTAATLLLSDGAPRTARFTVTRKF